MNKATRMLATAGMAIAAGATIGAGAASAAPAAPAAPATAASSSSAAQADQSARRYKVVGYYRSASACYRAGRIGEMRHRWEDYSCVRVRSGFHRSTYALTVRSDNGHGQGGWPGGPGGPGHHPGGPGGPGGPNWPR